MKLNLPFLKSLLTFATFSIKLGSKVLNLKKSVLILTTFFALNPLSKDVSIFKKGILKLSDKDKQLIVSSGINLALSLVFLIRTSTGRIS
ncbi:MAG: hypothetical protein ACD_71C00088G0001, partial [uncultured bacterium (gcode 4)]